MAGERPGSDDVRNHPYDLCLVTRKNKTGHASIQSKVEDGMKNISLPGSLVLHCSGRWTPTVVRTYFIDDNILERKAV